MIGSSERRGAGDGRIAPDEPPELVIEIREVSEAEERRLAEEQARVLWEVTEWQLRNKSEHGEEAA